MVKNFTSSQFSDDSSPNGTMLRALTFISILYLIGVECYDCDGCRNGYTGIKRSKYFPSQPFKFYNRPPFSQPIRGPFSYTPPPGYTANDIGPPISNPRPYKVSKRPSNEGLGDEDLNNLVKYLSNKDLDKIVEYASEKLRYREPSDKNNFDYPPDFATNANSNEGYKVEDYERGRILNNNQNVRPSENRYINSDNVDSKYSNTQFNGPLISHPAYSQASLETGESKHQEEFSFLDAYIQKEIDGMSPEKSNIFTDSKTTQEEELPKPSNLRDDYEVSYTNNVPSVSKPENPSYKLENFANLPLMEYENSKLYKVSSYNVPHYSVISSNHQPQNPSVSFTSSSSSSINAPQVEPAPPASQAKEQSDAHLKAIKIWTHKSQGTAYTLHDDGTLSLEKPTRPRYKFN